LKDNLSFINKRLRRNEYVASFITAEISKRINRIVSLGDKITIRDVLNAFRFPEDLFITRLHSSGILRYAENDNDLDSCLRSTYTAKGLCPVLFIKLLIGNTIYLIKRMSIGLYSS